MSNQENDDNKLPGITQGLDERITRKSRSNLGNAARSSDDSPGNTPGIVSGLDDRITRKSRSNTNQDPMSSPQAGIVRGLDQRIVNKSRQGILDHPRSRKKSRQSSADMNPMEDEEEEEEDLGLDQDEETPSPKTASASRNEAELRKFQEGAIMPLMIKSEEGVPDKKDKSDEPERDMVRMSSSGMFRSFQRIKKKKKKQKVQVNSDEILRADFAFVDTYDKLEESNRNLMEEEEEMNDYIDYNDTSLSQACKDFFRGTGFVGLIIMAAIICSIVIPMSKAKKNQAAMSDYYQTEPPTSQPSSVEYAPILSELREITNEHTMLDIDTP